MSLVVPALSVGQLIGNYRVVSRLAEGGMGEVYEVVHTTLGRRAALKVIHPSLAQDATVVARFLREAQATNQVHHPGVVQIFEYGQLSERCGAPYFVMEFLEGETLSTCIRRAAARRRGHLGLSSLRLLQQVAKTLAAVHSQGLVHRDVKPANVMPVEKLEKTSPLPSARWREVLSPHRVLPKNTIRSCDPADKANAKRSERPDCSDRTKRWVIGTGRNT